MTLERDIEILKRVPFFADLPVEPLKLLAFSAEIRDLRDRKTLFTAGERADGGFVVMTGRIDLVRSSGEEQVALASLGPGTLIGELALIVETERPTTAVAIGPAKVIEIRRANFRRVLEEYPEIAEQMRDRVATRLGALASPIGTIAEAMDRIDAKG